MEQWIPVEILDDYVTYSSGRWQASIAWLMQAWTNVSVTEHILYALIASWLLARHLIRNEQLFQARHRQSYLSYGLR